MASTMAAASPKKALVDRTRGWTTGASASLGARFDLLAGMAGPPQAGGDR
jgi:hypothetical protein